MNLYQIKNYLTIIVGSFAVITAMGSVISFFGQERGNEIQVMAVRQQVDLDKQIAQLRTQLNDLQNIQPAAPTQSPLQPNVELVAMGKQVAKLQSDFDELKQVIVEDPVKALSLPLIRKDLADIDKRQSALASSVEAEISRIYEFSKWFLGLMITLAIGLVTMGFLRKREV